jgi:wyosine [tRNA(Phe)-imidazoG37] synthetase (radical SAM superfamily)
MRTWWQAEKYLKLGYNTSSKSFPIYHSQVVLSLDATEGKQFEKALLNKSRNKKKWGKILKQLKIHSYLSAF